MRAAQYLRYMVEAGASDLHIKVGLPPVLRVDGVLRHTPYEPLTAADTELIAAELLPESKLIEFRETNEADIGYTLEGSGRDREDHHDRLDDRMDQRAPEGPHHNDGGPHRGGARRRQLDRRPARDRL